MVDLHEFTIRFSDGPHADRTAVVSAHLRSAPKYVYVLDDGGIVSPDLIMAGDPAAHALAHTAAMYCRFAGDDDYRHLDFSDTTPRHPKAAP